MNGKLLYLSADDVRSLDITPARARATMLQAFERHFEGESQALKKGSLSLGPGHGFQVMAAADKGAGIASVKWVAKAPVEPGSGRAGINGLICVSDFTTGEPVAVMDGNEITLIRTAALSAVAAQLMVHGEPRSIGMIGCGSQAYAHLDALCDLFPSLQHVHAFSRRKASSDKLVESARARGLSGVSCDTHEPVVQNADIVITTVPGGPGLTPFIDARTLKGDVFVSAVDLGRSWMPESLQAFQFLATDSLTQGTSPADVDAGEVQTVKFNSDLTAMAGEKPAPRAGRKFFCFKGYSLADLAIASLVLSLAREKGGIGIELPR